jgi:hypothetical protein
MADVTFTFRIDAVLKAAFIAMAEERHVSSAQVLRGMIRDAVEQHRQAKAHDRWMLRQIKKAMHDAEDPKAFRMSGESVEDEWERQKDEIKHRDSR